MRKYLCAFAFVILVGGLFGSSAFADDTLVRFKGGVGVIPVSNVSGTQNANGRELPGCDSKCCPRR